MHVMHDQIRILGAIVDSVTLDQAVERAHEFVLSGQSHQVVTVNVDFIRLAQENAEFMGVINRSALSIADGMPLVWASKWLGEPLPERVTGVELVDGCCELAAREGFRVFLLGGADDVAREAGDVLQARYPGLQVVGAYSPPMGPFSDDEDQKMVAMINAAQPHMLFVAFGAPKQDLWIAKHRDRLHVPLAVGVGGVFNFLTGRVKRAPGWMQKGGLEWLYRVMQEPRRLWRRYFMQDMPVLVGIAVDSLLTRIATPAPQPVSIGMAQPHESVATIIPAISGLPAEPAA